ncbi:C4-dicarboxylate ABC transporter substrate-binding protein [Enterovibrio norvegicus FF-454]|uniref:C4-dicarboxylate ABC transporter substrate-binding protein n=2 Tax=Enterovibrio norvegicus TaxID=188144 RepID=A0A1E5C979_9GAMM|nr:TRAP transporter substrate-binding protein [Enterovibrio norvegicus]OEE62073.1 C4-dicarboxylate ABC transporter substrate-binding protein [Enterovibrio norvegicus FF-454]
MKLKQLAKLAVITILALPVIVSAKTMKVGMGDPIESDQGAYALRFKDLVEFYSGGDIKIKLYPGGALGGETEMVQNIRLGSLDMALVGIGNVTPFSKKLGALTMPYLITNSSDAVLITTGELGEYWNTLAKEEAGVNILGWTYSNFRHLTNSKRPVKNMEDVKGLKIRVPQNSIMLKSWEVFGANPIAMAWTETFTALQQKVVDGQDNPYIVNNTMKFYEVQPYLTEVHHQYSLQPLLIGNRTMGKLSEEHQAILNRAGLEAQQYALVFQMTEAENAKQNMIDNGVEVFTLEDEDKWVELAKEKVWPEFYEDIGGKESFDNVLQKMQK